MQPNGESITQNSEVWVAIIGLAGAWIKYMWDARAKRITTNVVILTEIARLIEVIPSHMSWWSKCIKKKDTDQVLIPFSTPVFDHQMDNLAELDRTYADKIIRFYSYLKFVNAYQQSRDTYKKLRQSREFDDTYQRDLQTLVDDYGKLFIPAFKKYKIKTRIR